MANTRKEDLGQSLISPMRDAVEARRFRSSLRRNPAPLHPPLHSAHKRQRPNALSKPPCASGPTFAITSIRRNAINISRPGSSIKTSIVRMVASATLRPSAGLLHRVQRLD